MTEVAFVRTVLGDVRPDSLGVTYAHEHLVIDGGRPVEMNPDFLLADVERLVAEATEARLAGARTFVDAMPADAGRNATKLAEISRRAGVHIVAPTGLHHERYYGPSHWSRRLPVEDLAALFIADVADGIDANDYSGPLVRRTAIRAGVVKVAGSEAGPSARDVPIFRAAAAAHAATGVPILTHCEGGTGAVEQLRLLSDEGVPPGHVVLSHVDKVVDTGYHLELLEAGAVLEYDQAFRWGDRDNGTLALLEAVVAAGHADGIVLGMDAARQGYYRAYGGAPGLAYLVTTFAQHMEARGLGADVRHRLFVENPARAFAFVPGRTAAEWRTENERGEE